MRMAILLGAGEVDPDVSTLVNKIELCKRMGWTPEEYGRQKWSDIRQFTNYFRWMDIKKGSIGELND